MQIFIVFLIVLFMSSASMEILHSDEEGVEEIKRSLDDHREAGEDHRVGGVDHRETSEEGLAELRRSLGYRTRCFPTRKKSCRYMKMYQRSQSLYVCVYYVEHYCTSLD